MTNLLTLPKQTSQFALFLARKSVHLIRDVRNIFLDVLNGDCEWRNYVSLGLKHVRHYLCIVHAFVTSISGVFQTKCCDNELTFLLVSINTVIINIEY